MQIHNTDHAENLNQRKIFREMFLLLPFSLPSERSFVKSFHDLFLSLNLHNTMSRDYARFCWALGDKQVLRSP